jgi:hypothetical protein
MSVNVVVSGGRTVLPNKRVRSGILCWPLLGVPWATGAADALER